MFKNKKKKKEINALTLIIFVTLNDFYIMNKQITNICILKKKQNNIGIHYLDVTIKRSACIYGIMNIKTFLLLVF